MASRAGVPGVWAGALGALFAAWLYGWRVIDPHSAAWLMQGDPAQHYLGSVFFLRGGWQWPPGAIAGFGADPTSVVFTDSIPWLALLAKLLGVTPGLQYFGGWMLLCHALAGVFAVRLLRRLGVSRGVPLVVGACFFVAAPALLLRAYGHEALMGHFLVLWALERALAPWRWGPWLLLVVMALGVHPYLAVMTGLVGVGAAVAACASRRLGVRVLLVQGLVSAVMLGFLAWGLGYGAGKGDVSAAGHGYFSANVLTWLDPMDWAAFTQQHQRAQPADREWSRFLPHLRQATGGQYEGFAYLGAGLLAAVAAAGMAAVASGAGAGRRAGPGLDSNRSSPSRAQWVSLWMAAGLLALWAVSLRPTLGPVVLADLQPGPVLARLLGIFRASGRFVWPLTYLVMALALARVARLRGGAVLLVAALVLQAADLHGKFQELRWRFREGPPGIERPLADPLWAQALARCPRLALVSADLPPPGWVAPLLAAGLAGATVEPAPTARRSAQADVEYREAVARLVSQQGWGPDTLYWLLPSAPGAEAALANLPATHQQRVADGRVLVVPRACLPA